MQFLLLSHNIQKYIFLILCRHDSEKWIMPLANSCIKMYHIIHQQNIVFFSVFILSVQRDLSHTYHMVAGDNSCSVISLTYLHHRGQDCALLIQQAEYKRGVLCTTKQKCVFSTELLICLNVLCRAAVFSRCRLCLILRSHTLCLL